MSLKEIKYSKWYSKLKELVHTTIRTHLHWKYKEMLKEVVKGEYIQTVIVIGVKRGLLKDFGFDVLCKDTDLNDIREIQDLFNSFKAYKDTIAEREFKPYNFEYTKFTLYTLKIVNQPRISDFFNSKVENIEINNSAFP